MQDGLKWWDIAGAILGTITTASIIGIWRSIIVSNVLLFWVNSSFSFEGYWKSSFKSHMGNYNNIEIFRIRQYGNNISMHGWSYSGSSKKVRRFSGKGKARGLSFATVYAVDDKGALQHGCYALRASQSANGDLFLKGLYVEFDHRDGEENISIGPEEYVAQKGDINFKDYIKLRTGIKINSLFSSLDRELNGDEKI